MSAARCISRRIVPATAVLALLCGCATDAVPKDALRLPESTLEVRSAQTRKLEAPSETAILTATVAVLQDMEFNIDRIERPLGVISASKVSDADDSGEKFGLMLLDIFCGAGGGGGCDNSATAKDEQRLVLTMVVLPSLENSEIFTVRVTLQRIIFDKADRVKIMERITAPEIYQEVFDNLRRALYIEVNES